MNLRQRFINFNQLQEHEKLGQQQRLVKIGLWLMIIFNLLFTAAYGWAFAPPIGTTSLGRVFSLVVHVLFIDGATIIWLKAIDSSDGESQRRLALVMYLLGLGLSSIASVVFAYLQFGGDFVPVSAMSTIQQIGFYTMLVAAFAQFVAAYGYPQLGPAAELARQKALVRRTRNIQEVAFEADLAVQTQNQYGDLLAPYRPNLVEQEARKLAERTLARMGYDPDEVKRALPPMPNETQPPVTSETHHARPDIEDALNMYEPPAVPVPYTNGHPT